MILVSKWSHIWNLHLKLITINTTALLHKSFVWVYFISIYLFPILNVKNDQENSIWSTSRSANLGISYIHSLLGSHCFLTESYLPLTPPPPHTLYIPRHMDSYEVIQRNKLRFLIRYEIWSCACNSSFFFSSNIKKQIPV